MEFKEVSKDERRTIYATEELLQDNKEVSIIKLNKGKAIGGCIHNEDEYCFMMEGSGEITLDTLTWEINKGDYYVIAADTPHMFYALEDSIILEWGIKAGDKQNNPKDEDMLKAIKEIND